jgi:hypothetical protein
MESLCALVILGIRIPLVVEVRSIKAERFGDDVPMPILPNVSMRTRSRFLVNRIKGMELVVPNLEEVVALLLPVIFHDCAVAFRPISKMKATEQRKSLFLITEGFKEYKNSRPEEGNFQEIMVCLSRNLLH